MILSLGNKKSNVSKTRLKLIQLLIDIMLQNKHTTPRRDNDVNYEIFR